MSIPRGRSGEPKRCQLRRYRDRSRSAWRCSRRATRPRHSSCGRGTSIAWSAWRARDSAPCRRGGGDEEDVALSAFKSLLIRAEQGKFPELEDRDDLWQLLYVLTVRKAVSLSKREHAKRRGGGAVCYLSDLPEAQLQEAVGDEPTPELAFQMAEECRRLVDALGDETLQSVALWKMEGYTNKEVAAKLGVVEQTVERKLRRIRELWTERGTA